MTDNINLSDNDPDLLLAKRYGQVLAGERSITESENLLLDKLIQARDTADRFEAQIPVSNSEIAWKRLQQTISVDEPRILSLPKGNRWYWAAAAAILLISISSVLLMRQVPVPVLMAESGASISFIELADGSNVTLRPNSRLYQIGSSTYSLSGEALFEVSHQPERTFSVEAGLGRVIVTGTRFNLSDRNETSMVHLLEGSVIFETTDRASSVSLSPGEAASVSSGNRLDPLFTFEPDEVTGWIQSRLFLRDREVSDVISELEFHYNISIEIPPTLDNIALGGSVALENPEQSLFELGIVLGGEFIEIENRTYQFRQR